MFHINTSSTGQFDCPFLPDKKRRHPQQGSPTSLGYRQKNLAISVIRAERNYCRIHIHQIEYEGRLGASEFRKKDRMEPFANFFLQNFKDTGRTEKGLVCIKTILSVSSVYDMETGSNQYSKICNITGQEQKSQLCLSQLCFPHSA